MTLVPICVCTWKLGRVSGVIVALFSAFVALKVDLTERLWHGHFLIRYDHSLVPHWNAVMLLLLFSIVVWLLWSLKQFQLGS